MRFLLSVCFYSLLASLFFTDVAEASSVKISTWNLNWLLSPEAGKKYPLPDDIPRRQIEDWKVLHFYANKLSPDIIALEEVENIEAAAKLFPASQYYLYQTSMDIPQKEVLAIRRNLDISVVQNQDFNLLAENPRNPSYPLRPGLDATLHFKNGPTLRLLAVHLKSGCWEKSEKEKKHACPLLYKQFKDISDWLALRVKENQNFILLGDFNRRLSLSDFAFKKLTLTHPDLLILPTSGFASPCQGGEYFIDHIILRRTENMIFLPGSLRVQTYRPKDQKYILSDHCAVSIKINVNR